MATYTPNLNLKKPSTGEKYDVIADNNDAKDKIDNESGSLRSQLADMTLNVKTLKLPSDPDDTLSFQRALDTSLNIFIPSGTYNISDTLKIRRDTIIKGTYRKTIVNFTADNKPLMVANSGIDTNTQFSGCVLYGIDFKGLGKTFNQDGLIALGFISEINKCSFYNFKRGIVQMGVRFDMFDVLFGTCGIGISIQDYPASGFNTMLHYDTCRFYGCDIGMSNQNDGQIVSDNVVNMVMKKVIFEDNIKPFDLRVFSGVMESCWFESNTVRATTKKYSWFFINNRFEVGTYDQTFDFVTGDATYTGVVDINPKGGVIGGKKFKLQRYNTTSQDISTKSIKETIIGTNPIVAIENSDDLTDRAVLEVNYLKTAAGVVSKSYNKLSQVMIKPDGTIQYNGIDPKFTNFAVTKLATGRYKIKFALTPIEIGGIPQVFVSSPTSEQSDTSTNMFYYAIRMRNEGGSTAYASYNGFNIIYVDVYNKSSDALADGFVYLTLYHA